MWEEQNLLFIKNVFKLFGTQAVKNSANSINNLAYKNHKVVQLQIW